MALHFGTSGIRGLVTEMTDRACYLSTRAFARYLKDQSPATTVSLAGDYRSSTPRIMVAVATALADEGLTLDYCGFISTPAVTFHAIGLQQASIMVTGSHIPDDRNGIKFNMPWGEVLKRDEPHISALAQRLEQEGPFSPKGQSTQLFDASGQFAAGAPVASLGQVNRAAQDDYVQRSVDFFGTSALAGRKLVFYEHSSVCRDFLPGLLRQLGAEVLSVGRSEHFVPVDTEAVENTEQLAQWVAENNADALLTTDGDGDRPLLVDEKGTVLRGDVLGILVARFLRADSVSVPVSCNTALEKTGWFPDITRTRIGSPFVIEAMMKSVREGAARAVGYEANGGFLTATDIQSPFTTSQLNALPTRDAVLPLVAAVVLTQQESRPLSDLVAALPSRYTWSGLLRGVSQERGKALVAQLQAQGEPGVLTLWDSSFGSVQSLDFTDGARITFDSGEIVHLRPSGNAPEFRCYTEADSRRRAQTINEKALTLVLDALSTSP